MSWSRGLRNLPNHPAQTEIPVLQLTGVGELLYAAGIFAGLLIGR